MQDSMKTFVATAQATITIATVLGLNSLFSLPAQAALITFTNRSSFLSETGATSVTGPLPNLGLIPGGANARATVGAATFSLSAPAKELYIGPANDHQVPPDFTALLPGNEIGISERENLNVDLAFSAFSFGFDFVEAENDPTTFINAIPVESIFSVRLINDETLIDSFTFNAPTDMASFIGVANDQAFNRVEIEEIEGGIDNEFFGQFYAGSAPNSTQSVPEPATLIGLILAIVASKTGIKHKLYKL